MKLTFSQIASIAQGAVSITEAADGIHFHRFTQEQERVYACSRFHPRQEATAGIRLHFQTDSRTLYLKVQTGAGSTRRFFSHDILVDGRLVGSLQNRQAVCYGEFEDSFTLGDGLKTVCIHFPWSVCSVLKELRLDAGSRIVPVRKKKKMLIFGDSITQGADALHPMNRYAAALADALDAEEINKGIGGEGFCPWLASLKDDFEPDHIVVSYGTNHWDRTPAQELRAVCRSFFDSLTASYPNTPIFALTPIWRKDHLSSRFFDSFEQLGEIIADVAGHYKNVICICGRYFVPEEEAYFADGQLHPNDAGFQHYSDCVCARIRSYL